MNNQTGKYRSPEWKRKLAELLEPRHVEPRTPEWELWTQELTRHMGHVICARKAAAKTDAPHPCIKPPLEKRTACRNHGGKSIPPGPHHHSYQGKGRSKLLDVIPLHMQASFAESREDADRLSLDDEIALTRMREKQLLLRLSSGESGPRWQAAKGAMEEVRVAMARGDAKAANTSMSRLDGIISSGVADEAVWEQLERERLVLRRLVETERKRLEVMHGMIPAERARLMMAAMLSAVTRHVSDRAALGAISLELQSLLTGRPQVEPAEEAEATTALGPGEVAAGQAP